MLLLSQTTIWWLLVEPSSVDVIRSHMQSLFFLYIYACNQQLMILTF
uniref:Uncharacterized protein n=1 Tax=Rhizophora mucronata TaxID=61149 RepID=A0A2P2QNW9_RHIMU